MRVVPGFARFPTPMSDRAGKAVLLSYASQDTDEAIASSHFTT